MPSDGLDERKIAGLSGEALAFLAVADPDHLADPFAERGAARLVAARRIRGGLGATGGLSLRPDRFPTGPAPAGPQAVEAAARLLLSRRRRRILRQHHGGRQDERPGKGAKEDGCKTHDAPYNRSR